MWLDRTALFDSMTFTHNTSLKRTRQTRARRLALRLLLVRFVGRRLARPDGEEGGLFFLRPVGQPLGGAFLTRGPRA
jgi:hypothetical protein